MDICVCIVSGLLVRSTTMRALDSFCSCRIWLPCFPMIRPTMRVGTEMTIVCGSGWDCFSSTISMMTALARSTLAGFPMMIAVLMLTSPSPSPSPSSLSAPDLSLKNTFTSFSSCTFLIRVPPRPITYPTHALGIGSSSVTLATTCDFWLGCKEDKYKG